MDSKQRAEAFILVRQKLDEILDIIQDTNPEGEFLATYCFGLPVTEEGEGVYEFFAGYTADSPEEMEAMLTTVTNFYEDNEEGDSSDINYWLNLN
jgi:hypothetical protein